MAAIRGDLSVLSVANLVQALALDHATGVLALQSGNDRRALRIGPGGIRLVRGSHHCQRLDKLLRRKGRDSFMLTHLSREWMLSEICDLFTWSRGTFAFEKEEPAELSETGPFAGIADCNVTSVALEAARRADELPRIKEAIGDVRHVPIRTENASGLEYFGMDREAVSEVFLLADGVRPVIHILQLSAFPRFVALEAIYRMTRGGALRLIPPPVAAAA